MRALFFRAILKWVKYNKIELLQRIMLQILLNTTAEGFGTKRIRIWHMNISDAMEAYMTFTKQGMQQDALASEHLYDAAFNLGARIRKITGFEKADDLANLIFYLYENIGITMSGSMPGELTVSSCYFSRHYLPSQCQYMSAMDSGIISGLNGGGRLDFSSRITEGCTYCKAHFME